MARLPRYQESGLISADIPRMDFANVREQSKQAETLSGALTRISEFAFGRVKEEQEKENKLLAIQVRSELEGEVQKRMADLTIKVETGQITNFNDIQSEVAALRGLAVPLGEISPEQAQGLMQSISSSGKSLLTKSADVMVKAYQAGVQVEIDEVTKAMGTTLQTAYEVTQDPEQLARIVNAARGKIYAQAVQAPALLPDAIKNFESVRRGAEHSAMTKYFTSTEFGATETERLQKLDANDAGNFTSAWKAKGEPERIEIKKRMYESTVARLQASKRDQEVEKMANDDIYINTYKRYLVTTNPVEKSKLAKDLVRSADNVADIERILKTSDTGGDALLYSNLRAEVERGRITDHRQLQRYVGPNGLDKTQLDRLQTQLYQQRNQALRDVNKQISDQSGVGNVVGLFDPKEGRVVKRQAIQDRFDRLLEERIKEDEALPADKVVPIDYGDLLTKAITDYNNTDAKNQIVNAAKAKLKLYEKEAARQKREVEITQDTNVEDLKKLKIFKDDQLDNIRKQIQIIKDNQTK